jgi:pSer/pThr/pTyr-binding forkhead associated (FHA) protein
MKEMPVIIVQLVHIQGPLKGQIQEFTEPRIIIGRHPSCQVQFPTDLTTISRTHAEFVREGNRFKVIDRSTNGTFVNGKRVTEAFLKDGDVIMFTEGGPKVSYLSKVTDAVQPEQVAAPPAPEPPPVPKAAPPVAPEPPVEAPHKATQPQRQAVQKAQVPLIVQYGPTLRTYKELPVVIGKKPDCEFVLNHSAITDQHAQIFFSTNQYWVKDLTGRGSVSINGTAIGFEAPLHTNDILSLAANGPAFRFLGEGRLAEYEEMQGQATPEKEQRPSPASEEKKGKSILKDFFKK